MRLLWPLVLAGAEQSCLLQQALFEEPAARHRV